jgi:hypothetical protein
VRIQPRGVSFVSLSSQDDRYYDVSNALWDQSSKASIEMIKQKDSNEEVLKIASTTAVSIQDVLVIDANGVRNTKDQSFGKFKMSTANSGSLVFHYLGDDD